MNMLTRIAVVLAMIGALMIPAGAANAHPAGTPYCSHSFNVHTHWNLKLGKRIEQWMYNGNRVGINGNHLHKVVYFPLWDSSRNGFSQGRPVLVACPRV